MPLDRDTAIIASINPVTTPEPEFHIDYDLDMAFKEGVGSVAPNQIPPFGGYSDFSDVIKQAVRQAYAQVLAAIAPSPWQPMTLAGAWVAGAQAPEYRREGFDIIRLRGTVTTGTGTITTLPAGFRPSQEARFSVVHGANTDVGVVSVSTGGVVSLVSGIPSSVHLDGISFSITPAG